MTIRERIENNEKIILAPYAVLSAETKGRERYSEPCPNRTEFMRDRDRIVHSKTFRRLKHKTQVFLSPEGDHYRTRLTHTLEVSQISRTIARALMLNEDLTEAIALGHDLGHTPFGHAGERALNEVKENGFTHNGQSLRVVEKLENDGKGLNLTYEVRDGILCHSGDLEASTLCGLIVKYADRIAYINHDIDDAIRAGILSNESIPKHLSDILGDRHNKRIDTLVGSIIQYSLGKPIIGMDEHIESAMMELREFLFENVYRNPLAKGEEGKGVGIIQALFHYFVKNKDRLPEDYIKQLENDTLHNVVADYIAGMTDRYAVARYEELFVPKGWSKV
ncbi:MAG: deoxyguanosinetriphosphate triphosphohydrolase [Ruminococcaceae bacterium]|nr:deoxyguanosinetriphosphate triphosphohydrolase [Oscillospiraceae bacterium]